MNPPVEAPTSRQIFPVTSIIPVFEGVLQLESAAADVLQIFAEQANDALRGDLRARFLDFLIVRPTLCPRG